MKKRLLLIILFFSISKIGFSQITDTQVISNANSYLNHSWYASSNNIWNNINCGGKTVNTPFWVNVGSHTALPYCWGGNSTLSDFDYYLTQNKSAGDDNTATGYGAEPSCSVGVDCSGFVSRCYGLSTHYSTTMLNSNSLFGHYGSYNDLQVGDFLNKPGSHTRLVTQINNNGSITVLEAGSGTSNVGGNGLWKVFQWTYTISQLSQYNPQYYTNMTSGNPPSNDDCDNAITIQSNDNCNNTGGTVDNATYDNLSQPNCDNLSNTIKGVWYKFTASNSTHTIKITPNNAMNAVVVVFSGSCNNLSEIDCNGAVSGGSGDIVSITYNSFNIGQTYRVWIYDYGNIDPTNGDFNICITHPISSGQPDIIIENESISPTSIQAGNTMSVSCRIKNDSPNNATTSGRVGYYLSTNATFDTNDILLGSSFFGTLNSYQYSDENDSFIIPNGTSSGNYYIIFYADYQENIEESIEYNNREPVSFVITDTATLTYVPDDNFEQALIDLGYDDVMDDYVLTSNISGIETLSLDNKNISDLTGIEDFTSLWGLVCSNNNLSSIDISENSNLKELYCSDNNLTNIDISNNSLLEKINCNNNFLSTLDISNNNNLYFLAITNNSFNNFDFSSHPSLTKIFIKDNNFTSIDLSNNTNLIMLSCANNNLSYLNLKNGNNQVITNLWATNNPNLNCIQVDDENSAANGTGVYGNWVVDTNSVYSENCVLGIDEENLNKKMEIYPNPTKGLINLKNYVTKSSYQIFNMNGQLIYSSKIKGNSIDISFIRNGIYILKIFDEDNKSSVYRVIKE